jgi:Right handed beta helix region
MATNYYVDGIDGDDANAGTSEGSGNALKTIDAGVLKLTAIGDHLYIKANVSYLIGNTSAYPINGTAALPVITEGYTTTPGDGGQVTINGTGTLANGSNNYRNYHIIRNIIVKNCTARGFAWTSCDYCGFQNCEAIDNGSNGFHCDNYNSFDRCVAIGNLNGIYTDTYTIVSNSYVYDNDTYGIRMSSPSLILFNCVVAGGSTAAVFAGAMTTIINCTIDGFGTGIGLTLTGTSPSLIMNTIFHDCSTAINCNAASNRSVQVGHNNMMSGNTTDYSNWIPTENDFEGTPDFTDEANGDYTLGDSSDAIGAGFGGIGQLSESVDIGAYRVVAAGGGQIVLTG